MWLGVDDPEQWFESSHDSVFQQWQAFYKLEPFGGERELLARIAAFLQIIAWKDRDEAGIKSVNKCAQELVQSMMPADWIGQPEKTSDHGDSIQKFEAFVSKAFG